MNNAVAIRQNTALAVTESDKALALIKRTVAADTNADEFDMFISMARSLRLDPLRRQIYAVVYNKTDPKKRKMSLIVGIDGFRTIADRTGNYRPDDEEPTLELDEATKGSTNPLGLVKASVRVFKFSHGAWHKVTASAYWDEYAPIKDEWVDDPETGRGKKTGRKTLDASGKWATMPRVMLSKVAEALALRKAWPDDFSNVYAEEEMERSRALDLTASEIVEQAAVAERQAKIGGPAIIIDWLDGKELEGVPTGQFADRAMHFLKANAEEPSTIVTWRDRNRHSLTQFWAVNKTDAMEIKKKIEAAEKRMAVLSGEVLVSG